jgi:hypothetical protein
MNDQETPKSRSEKLLGWFINNVLPAIVISVLLWIGTLVLGIVQKGVVITALGGVTLAEFKEAIQKLKEDLGERVRYSDNLAISCSRELSIKRVP